MNENTKTIGFVAAAAVVALIVWVTRPRLPELDTQSDVPDVLFDVDPLTAASLEIIEFDEENATLRPFKVAQVIRKEGEDAPKEWSIPSHDNYPADAEDQLSHVAAGLVGLKVLTMESDAPGDHAEYGVVDPASKKLKPGDVGVGTRVEMRDEKDEVLVSLIVGKEVPDRSELRYVRVAGKDPVYTVKLDTNKFSTKFEDWIEDDLLKLQTWDIRQAEIYDYSVDFEAGRQIPRSRMTLDYDDSATDKKWKLSHDKVFKDGDWVDQVIGDDQELDTTKLNDMKNEFDDLKIVDVARKPKGLSDNLKDTGQIKLDAQSSQSLASRGFYLAQVQDHYELLSSEGEISVLMKDGVRYVLRFGEVAGRSEDSADEGKAEAAEKEEGGEESQKSDESDKEKVNRYLFVMAEFDPAVIDPPELEPLPEEKEAAEGEEAKEKESNGDGEEAEAAEQEKSGDEAKAGDDEKAADEKKSGDQAKAGDDEKAADEKKSDDQEAKAGDEEKAADEKKSDDQADKEKEDELAKERERIEKENKRKQEEYDEKINKGKERVKELNARFADWYYVISDEVYQKIHLSRDNVLKEKEKDEDDKDKSDDAAADKPAGTGTDLSDFDELKKEGLEGGEEE